MSLFDVEPPASEPKPCEPKPCEPKPIDCRPDKPACDGNDACMPHQDDCSDVLAALSSLPVAEAIDYAIGHLDSGDPCDTYDDCCPPTDDPFAA